MNTAQSMATHGFSQFELSKRVLNNLSQFDIKPISKLVLLFLCDCYNPTTGGVVFPSMPFIAEKLGVGLTATKQAIKELVDEGLILKSKKDKVIGNHNKYLLTQKVQNTTCEQSENELFKRAECDRFMITNNHEQKKEQTTNIDDYKILRDYATGRGAKNVSKYIEALKRNGSDVEIIKKAKQKDFIKHRAEKNVQESLERIEEIKHYSDNAVSYEECPSWVEFGKKIKGGINDR